MAESTTTGSVYVSRARVSRQAGSGQWTEEVGGPEMRGSPERRDVVRLCLHRTLWLVVSAVLSL